MSYNSELNTSNHDAQTHWDVGNPHTFVRNVSLPNLLALHAIYFGIILVVLLDWLGMFEYVSIEYSKYSRAVLVAVFILYIIRTGFKLSAFGFRFGNAFSYFLILAFTYSLISKDMFDNFYSTIRAAFWLLGTVAAYRLFITDDLNEIKLRRITIVTVIIAAIFNIIFISSLDPDKYENASAYLLLFCMPLLLLVRKSFLVYACITIACIAIVITVKRGALIGLILSFIAYALFYFKMNTRFLTFARGILAFVFLLAITYYMAVPRLDFIEKRFEDTSGSGRDIVYTLLINHYSNAEIKNQILGFGINSVQQYTGWFFHGSGTGIYAHSDWLQSLHDFGALGIIFIVWFYLKFLALIFYHYKNNSPHAPPLVMGFVILFLSNIYSQWLMEPNTIILGLLLAFAQATIVKESYQLNSAS